jgi:hypothetical protein
MKYFPHIALRQPMRSQHHVNLALLYDLQQ